MPTLRLPDALAGAAHATILRWRVAPGEAVEIEQVIVELETSDTLVAVRAGSTGTLSRIIAPVGTTVKVGSELGELSGNAAAKPAIAAAPAAKPAPAAASGPVATAILMPQAGNTMEEGKIIAWRVKAGDSVKTGQILCEIETDKSTIEFESPVNGTIGAIVVDAGASIAVKLPIAFLNDGVVPAAGSAPAVAAPASVAAASGPTATPILMPQAGNTMEEGKIITWRVKAGDSVKTGQILCEIETDKSTIEFESPVDGTIGAIIVPAGASIAVKLAIAYLNDGAVPAPGTPASPPAAKEAIPAKAPAVAKASIAPAGGDAGVPRVIAPAAGSYPASPAARRLAKEQGLDLASIGAGSGPNGRVLSTDLARAGAAGAKPGKGTAIAALVPITGPIADPVKKPLSKMRKAIATNLQQSKQTVPHFYLAVSVDAGALVAYAKRRKTDAGASVNDVVLAALGRAIHEFPAVRSRFEADGIVEYGSANIGIAVGLDDGLVVPVVMNVERLSLAQLAAETKRVVDNARHKGKLENLGKAVFSVSNLGMFGVDRFSAIINPPESGILAISAAREAVIVKDGAMRPGRLMELTLSADHRVVDGLLAAKFMNRLRELLEAPEQLA